MYKSKVILDSINAVTKDRITTFELTYPRFVHSELMTHRLFSRNSASSRAIPNERLRGYVLEDPVIPVWFGENQKGMKAAKPISEARQEEARKIILDARNSMLRASEALNALGMHKQIANRYIEPWMWITVIVTATELDNFFHLRTSQEFPGENKFLDENFFDPNFPAQPEIQVIARKAWLELAKSKPNILQPGQWHLPYALEEEITTLPITDLLKITTGRCARVSYLTHDGKKDPIADIGLHGHLLNGGHWSPFEHPAEALPEKIRSGNFIGWQSYRKNFPNEHYGKKLS